MNYRRSSGSPSTNAFTARRSFCSSFCTPQMNRDPVHTDQLFELMLAIGSSLQSFGQGRI